jgi:hypothetical protein
VLIAGQHKAEKLILMTQAIFFKFSGRFLLSDVLAISVRTASITVSTVVFCGLGKFRSLLHLDSSASLITCLYLGLIFQKIIFAIHTLLQGT